MKVGLVACCGKKLSGHHAARDLYQSALFRKSRQWVEANCDRWLILSAKYGVVDPETEIEDYDQTLNAMPIGERHAWSECVAAQMHALTDASDEIVILAGSRYCGWTDGFAVQRPLAGLGIGKQLQLLTRSIANRNASLSERLSAAKFTRLPADHPNALGGSVTWEGDGLRAVIRGEVLHANAQGLVIRYLADGDELSLSFLTVHPRVRRTGKAAAFLRLLTSIADVRGFTIYLEPVALYPADDLPTADDLRVLYGRFGFLPDDAAGKVMVRHPT
jgi:GNAT superfamily N-acetyltransferase